MAPIITLIRHAQGMHDFYRDRQTIIDPTLTELGVRECLDVRKEFPHHDKITHIMVSPLKRTIETAMHCFKPAIDRGVQVAAMPEVTANEPDGCNQGHAPEEITEWARSTFGGDFLNERSFHLMPSNWYDKSGGLYEYEESKLKLRASIARQILRRMAINAGDKAHIVVVSNWEFLQYLAEDNRPMGDHAEWRSYTIGSNDDATLVRLSS
jgi:broad specificity phosphatase PhoE